MAIRDRGGVERPEGRRKNVPASRLRDETKPVIIPLAKGVRDKLKDIASQETDIRSGVPFYVTDIVREAVDNWLEMRGLQRHCMTARRKVNRKDFVAFALAMFDADALVEEIKRQKAGK